MRTVVPDLIQHDRLQFILNTKGRKFKRVDALQKPYLVLSTPASHTHVSLYIYLRLQFCHTELVVCVLHITSVATRRHRAHP